MSLSLAGRRHVKAVHEARFGIGTDVCLHAEVPLVTFLGLVHLRIAFSILILRRTRRRNDRRVHQRALAHEQPSSAQERVDLLKDRLRQLMLLEQAPEFQQRCRVRHLFSREIDSHEFAHSLAVVEHIFQPLVAQAVPLLQEVHPQHPLHSDRLPADAPTLRIMPLDQRDQRRPRHDAFHLAQELPTPGHALLSCILQACKAGLFHGIDHRARRVRRLFWSARINQHFPSCSLVCNLATSCYPPRGISRRHGLLASAQAFDRCGIVRRGANIRIGCRAGWCSRRIAFDA